MTLYNEDSNRGRCGSIIGTVPGFVAAVATSNLSVAVATSKDDRPLALSSSPMWAERSSSSKGVLGGWSLFVSIIC